MSGDIKDILTRKSISPGQLALYKVLYWADQPLTLNSIAFMMREGDDDSADKVMMNLAGRILGTPGFENIPRPAYHVLFAEEMVNGIRHFTMQPQLRQAIDALPELKRVIEKLSVDAIYERFDQGEEWWLSIKR